MLRSHLHASRRSGAHRAPCLRFLRASAASSTEAQATATISEEELIEITKEYVGYSYFSINRSIEDQEKFLSEDYVFRGPAIGPFNKEDYLKRVPATKVKTAFPDMVFRHWGFCVDPQNPMRVYYFSQVQGTMTGDWEVNGQFWPATGKKIEAGPEAHSVEWTSDRKIKYQSVGYCVDRFYGGSPDGSLTVAVFAAFKAAGAPWVVDIIMNPLYETFQALIGKPQATPWEKLPEWYQRLPASRLKGSQGIGKV